MDTIIVQILADKNVMISATGNQHLINIPNYPSTHIPDSWCHFLILPLPPPPAATCAAFRAAFSSRASASLSINRSHEIGLQRSKESRPGRSNYYTSNSDHLVSPQGQIFSAPDPSTPASGQKKKKYSGSSSTFIYRFD